MFSLLKKLKFISETTIRERLRDSEKVVLRNLKIDLTSRRRTEILVSYLDNPAKSGAHYARMFAKENKVYVDNVVSFRELRERLEQDDNIQAIAFVDDFMGTGSTAKKGLESLSQDLNSILLERKINIVVIAIAGFLKAKDYLMELAEEKGFNLNVHLCEPLNSEDRCFSNESRIFPDQVEREKAKEVARKHGLQLVRSHPLGYDDSEAIVVFADTCPNNTLPIIWSSSNWLPLFER